MEKAFNEAKAFGVGERDDIVLGASELVPPAQGRDQERVNLAKSAEPQLA